MRGPERCWSASIGCVAQCPESLDDQDDRFDSPNRARRATPMVTRDASASGRQAGACRGPQPASEPSQSPSAFTREHKRAIGAGSIKSTSGPSPGANNSEETASAPTGALEANASDTRMAASLLLANSRYALRATRAARGAELIAQAADRRCWCPVDPRHRTPRLRGTGATSSDNHQIRRREVAGRQGADDRPD